MSIETLYSALRPTEMKMVKAVHQVSIPFHGPDALNEANDSLKGTMAHAADIGIVAGWVDSEMRVNIIVTSLDWIEAATPESLGNRQSIVWVAVPADKKTI